MQILSSLLQDSSLDTWTQAETDQINNLPSLNHYTTGTPNERFIYDEDESLICYVDQDPIFETPEYQEILTREPIHRFPHIDIYEAQVSCIPLDSPRLKYTVPLD